MPFTIKFTVQRDPRNPLRIIVKPESRYLQSVHGIHHFSIDYHSMKPLIEFTAYRDTYTNVVSTEACDQIACELYSKNDSYRSLVIRQTARNIFNPKDLPSNVYYQSYTEGYVLTKSEKDQLIYDFLASLNKIINPDPETRQTIIDHLKSQGYEPPEPTKVAEPNAHHAKLFTEPECDAALTTQAPREHAAASSLARCTNPTS